MFHVEHGHDCPQNIGSLRIRVHFLGNPLEGALSSDMETNLGGPSKKLGSLNPMEFNAWGCHRC